MTRVVEGQDIRMLQTRQDPNFLYESQFALLGAWIRVQNLHCHLAVVPGVICEIDRGERALADLSPDFVSSGESSPERADRVVGRERARHAVSSLISPF